MGNQNSSSSSNGTKKNKGYKVPSGAGKPESPSKPQVEYIGDDVMVRWDEPRFDGGCPIIGYVLQFNRVDGEDIWESYRVEGTECLLKNLDDTFVFRVVAENLVGYSEPSETSVPVSFEFSEPVLLVPLTNVTRAIEYEKVELNCRVWGMPNPELTWYLNGEEMVASKRILMHTDGIDYKLVFNHIKLSDDGEIRAVARNLLGEIESTATIVVEAPPRIRVPKNYEEGLISRVGENLRLKFGCTGKPKPEIFWYHEGEPIKGKFKMQEIGDGAVLTLDNVSRNDAGEYTIRVENSIGEDLAHVLVTIADRPRPPDKPTVIQLPDNSCLLEWEPLHEDVTAYIVEYFRDGWDVWLKALATKHRGCKIRDLIPGSKYRFRIRAENHFGTSDGGEESVQIYIPDSKKDIGSMMSSIQEDEFEVVGELNQNSSPEKIVPPPIPETRKPQNNRNDKKGMYGSKPEVSLPAAPDDDDLFSELSFKVPSPPSPARVKTNQIEDTRQPTRRSHEIISNKLSTPREVNPERKPPRSPLPPSVSPVEDRPVPAKDIISTTTTSGSQPLFRRNQLIGNSSNSLTRSSNDSLRATPSPQSDSGNRYYDHYAAAAKKARGTDRFEKYRKESKVESSSNNTKAPSFLDSRDEEDLEEQAKDNSFIIVEDADDDYDEDEASDYVVSQLIVPVKSGSVKISTSFDNGSLAASSLKSSMDDLDSLSLDPSSRNHTPDYLSSSPLPPDVSNTNNNNNSSRFINPSPPPPPITTTTTTTTTTTSGSSSSMSNSRTNLLESLAELSASGATNKRSSGSSSVYYGLDYNERKSQMLDHGKLRRRNPSASPMLEECGEQPGVSQPSSSSSSGGTFTSRIKPSQLDNEPVPREMEAINAATTDSATSTTTTTTATTTSIRTTLNNYLNDFIVVFIFLLLGPLLFKNLYTVILFCLLLIKIYYY